MTDKEKHNYRIALVRQWIELGMDPEDAVLIMAELLEV